MENYEVEKRLGKGAQGSVFLVKRKDTGKQYVLKKVECTDEGEANKAFQEAMALQELQHPYVCGYKEFFVTWDPAESAMFVCIIMEFYKNGDMEGVLKKRRQSKQPIDELILKKWLGQIVEALVFVHKKQVIHRDLKPSNIFMREDLSISIGDFGVATIMGDARTKTRTTVGSMVWMAPEVLERPYDERSDVWSAGCILLEMATCSMYDHGQIAAKLFEIKKSPPALEDTLKEIGTKYSSDLVSVIRTMLRLNFKQRPTAIELLDLPYIKDCLALNKSDMVDARKKDLTDVSKVPVPKDGGYLAVFEYIKNNMQSENCVREALSYLEELSQSKSSDKVDDSGKRILVKALREHIKCLDIQVLGCKILNNLIVTAAENDFLYSRDVISIVPLAMKSHSSSLTLLKAAVTLLMSLSSDERAAETIGLCGGIQDVLAAMRAYPKEADLMSICCSAIWSLTVQESNCQIVTEERGVADVIKALSTHSTNADLVEMSAAALLSLSMEDDNLDIISELDCVTLLIDAIQNHMGHAKVVKNSCMALACLVEANEESAYKVLNNPVSDGKTIAGIPILLQAYNKHKDNVEVVEGICTLFMELTEYDELCKSMVLLFVPNTLEEISSLYKANEDVMAPCDAALAKFKGGKAVQRPVSSRKRR